LVWTDLKYRPASHAVCGVTKIEYKLARQGRVEVTTAHGMRSSLISRWRKMPIVFLSSLQLDSWITAGELHSRSS
jgi:hypothetical protein